MAGALLFRGVVGEPAVRLTEESTRWRERYTNALAPCLRLHSDLVVARAEGAHLFTLDGRDVLDFGCGIGVTNLGHRHPAVVAAVRTQLDTLWHTSVTMMNTTTIRAAEAIVRVAPRGLDRVFLCNSGTESIEAAIKLTRKATGRSELIAFEGSFHGRTMGALSLTSAKSRYRAGIGPLLPGVHFVPYPRHSLAATEEAIERLFESRVDPREVAAVVVEPILGEAGCLVPPPQFLPWLRTLCDEWGILLVVDEVQTGIGRTGKMFAHEHAQIAPDIVCMAKALGNGVPIGAIVSSHGVMGSWEAGDHGTTFGGNPLACSAAIAVLETIERERLLDRARVLGARILDRVLATRRFAPSIREVRGLGLMIGIEVSSGDLARRVRSTALQHGLLVLGAGRHDEVVRLLPPLTLTDQELDLGLDILETSLREVLEP